MKIFFLLIITIALAQPAFSKEAKPTICQDINKAIDENIKSIALSQIDGNSDKSAAQQTARNISENNHLQIIQINLNLLDRHKCPPRKTIIDPYMYKSYAIKCALARLGGEGKENVKELCDFNRWEFDPASFR